MSRKQRSAEQERNDEMLAVLATPAGRAVLWRILESCGIYRTTYNSDAAAAAFNEGRRNVGLEIVAAVEAADPFGFVNLVQANAERIEQVRFEKESRAAAKRNEDGSSEEDTD